MASGGVTSDLFDAATREFTVPPPPTISPRFYMNKELDQNLSGNEVYYTNYSILLEKQCCIVNLIAM